MGFFGYVSIIIACGMVSFFASRYFAASKASDDAPLAALPHFYGWCGVVWFLIPLAILGFALPYIVTLSGDLVQTGLILFTALALGVVSAKVIIRPTFHARKHIERWIRLGLFLSAALSIAITALIILSMFFESWLFFQKVPIKEFFFGLEWSPQTALREDQAGSSASFGMIPVFLGTLLITCIAMLIATPLALFSAIYISEYCSNRTRHRIKPVLEILAGIPTVVYGYFAVIAIAPLLRGFGEQLNKFVAFFNWPIDPSISSESALVAGTVMGIMIIPFVLSLADDALNSVPRSLRDGSLALGSTPSETMKKVLIPAALPGIISAVLLGVSRAIGETMIVVMAAGLIAQLTFNPFESVTTVTVQIVTLLVGDQEFDSAKTLAAYALGLTLFFMTLLLNIASAFFANKYKKTL